MNDKLTKKQQKALDYLFSTFYELYHHDKEGRFYYGLKMVADAFLEDKEKIDIYTAIDRLADRSIHYRNLPEKMQYVFHDIDIQVGQLTYQTREFTSDKDNFNNEYYVDETIKNIKQSIATNLMA